MTLILVSLILGVAGAATSAPSQVPAQGASEAVISLERAGMFRIETTGRTGLSCELVDRVRGPFARSGSAGKSHCKLELLLDAGSYKLRLWGPRKSGRSAKASYANIVVTPFAESQTKPLRIDEGQSVDTHLKAGEQASFWIHSDGTRALNLSVVGRTAGLAALWRDGVWLEDIALEDHDGSEFDKERMHRWELSKVIEEGDYRLVAYGTSELRWASGVESDALLVANGFESAPAGKGAAVVIPWTGYFKLAMPRARSFFMAALKEAPPSVVSIVAEPFDAHGALINSASGSCNIVASSADPRCIARTRDDERARLLILHGPPGTAVDLFWGSLAFGRARDGEFGLEQSAPIDFDQSGDYRVGIREIPADIDAAPLGCAVFAPVTGELVASDLPQVAKSRPLVRSFNSAGRRDDLWFHTDAPLKLNIEADKERHSRCELFALLSNRIGKRVAAPAPSDESCKLTVDLPAGDFDLALYEGNRGIQTVRIWEGASDTAGSAQTPPKTQCSMRAFLVEDAKKPYTVATNRPPLFSVRGLELRSANESAMPALTVAPPWISTAAEPSSALPPAERALQTLVPEHPLFLDFDRAESRSLLFGVPEAGLYDVTTQGLLATSCTIRTPAIVEVANDAGAGRGRNCLVAQYLRPGNYLLTIRTRDLSRGRLSVRLSKRAPRAGPALALASNSKSSEAFFRVDAGELLQQRLSIAKPDSVRLETSARGIPLRCRLDDEQGWPLVAVPAPCAFTERLLPGEYLWTQLPMAVESMRHTALSRVEKPVIWTGAKVHPITLHTWHDAVLSGSGKDAWFLNLEADLEVTFALTNRMQGRLYRINPEDKSLQPVEVIPPAGDSNSASAPAPSADAPSNEAPADAPIDDAAAQDSSDTASAEERESAMRDAEHEEEINPADDGSNSQIAPAPAPVAAPRDSMVPGGKRIHLAAGPYKLITEHSQGDTAIAYRLFVGSEVLTPGTSREVVVPSETTVRMPKDGTLRVHTSGEEDVRCRLENAEGKLIAESRDNGDDWNCAFAEPLAAGDYQLLIASETSSTGTTTVHVSLPPVEDAGVLSDGQALQLRDPVVYASIPRVGNELDERIQEVSFAAEAPFSCALEDGAGALLGRQLNVTDCNLLIRPQGNYRVRLWTLDKPAEVKVSLEAKPIASFNGGTLAQGKAGRVVLANAGHFETGIDVFCLPDSAHGLFRWCANDVSLEAGGQIFARPRSKGSGEISLREMSFPDSSDASGRRERAQAARIPFIEAFVSSDDAVHLLAAESAPGERPAVSCAFTGGARVVTDRGCFAASNAGERAIARWFLPVGIAADASSFELFRAAAILPRPSGAIAPGQQQLHWRDQTGRFTLPADPSRLELVLPQQGWAVLLSKEKRALDLCPPSEDLSRCVLNSAGGGELVVWSAGDGEAALTCITNIRAPAPVALAGIYEDASPSPGPLAFSIAAADSERTLSVRGAARCAVTLPDGLRIIGCDATVPAHSEASLQLDADDLPLAINLAANDQERLGFGSLPPVIAIDLLPAQATPLGPEKTDRILNLASDALLHLRVDSGAVALAQGATILAASETGRSGAIDWFAKAGSYRVVVRPFGLQKLTGSLSWTSEPVAELSEGVGPETWIAPEETRLFRFTTASPGKVGLGLQLRAETLDCAIKDSAQNIIGTGCQQYLALERGTWFLQIRAPKGTAPQRFHPVLFGLAGAQRDVPEEYLRDFFQRTEVAP